MRFVLSTELFRPLRRALAGVVAPIFAGVLLASALAAPATAEPVGSFGPIRSVPIQGAGGRASFDLRCHEFGENQYLVGVGVQTGSWVDYVEPQCATLGPDLKWKLNHGTDGFGGSGGGDVSRARCKSGYILRGLSVTFTKGYRQVHTIQIFCYSIKTGERDLSGVGPMQPYAAEIEGKRVRLECREGETVSGLTGRYGQHVNALGLWCHKFLKPEAKPEPKPAEPEKKPSDGMIFCRGGGMQVVGSGAMDLSVILQFKRAAKSSKEAIPGPGECAWQDRPVRKDEPRHLYLPLAGEVKKVVETGQNGGLFLVSVTRFDVGFWVDKIHSVDPTWKPNPEAGGQKKPRDFVKQRIERNKARAAAGEDAPDNAGAGLAAAAPGFGGSWSARADGTKYTITLRQDGASVSGGFTGSDGSRGDITGKVKAGVLTFSFEQADGIRGTGRFRLAADGSSFSGSYKVDGDTGAWNGTRQ